MKKLLAVLSVLVLVLGACSYVTHEENVDNSSFQETKDEVDSSENESALEVQDNKEYTDAEYESAVKGLGYTEEQLSYIEGLFEEGLSPLAVINPLEYSKAFGKTSWPEGVEYVLGSFYFDPEVYADYGGPIGFIYIRKDEKIKIVPETADSFASVNWDVIDGKAFYYGDSREIRIYNVDDISAPSVIWHVPEEKLLNKEWGPILASASSKQNGEIIVIWVNRPEDYDEALQGKNSDNMHYMITVINPEGNTKCEYDTGLKAKRYTYGRADVVYPEIKAVYGSKILFKVNNVHYVFDYSKKNPVAEQYIFTENDVVKYSNIDFESDFAQSAVTAVAAYITENYSGNEDIMGFNIRRAEIDEDATNREINLTGGAVKELFEPEDTLNSFLVIRTITDIEYADGITREKEYKYLVLYDPENKYKTGKIMGESGWRFIGGSKEMFDAPPFDDNRFYIYFGEGKIG